MDNQIPGRFPSELQARTLELYDKAHRRIKNKDICKATGLSPAWLSSFLNRKIINPPAGKLEALYNYLSPVPFKL